MKPGIIVQWIAALLATAMLWQTLFFKFSGAEESVALFTKLGVEPWGRWLSGVLELIAGALLLLPKTRHWGALLGAGLMAGAIMAHLTIIGIESADDGGQLFVMAWVTLLCCLYLVWASRARILSMFQYVSKTKPQAL